MILKQDKLKTIFKIKADERLVNAIRKGINLIPTVAIDFIEISKNDSPLYDETIAHRMGLIPLKTPKGTKEEDVSNFKLNSKKPGFVQAEDISGDIEVVFGRIPITLLNEGQELKIKGETRVGKGKEHAKFVPGSLFYREACEIIVDKTLEAEIKKNFPENSIRSKGNKIIVMDDLTKPLVDFCEGLAQKMKKEIEVKPTGDLIITLESFGHLEPKEIIKKSISSLKEELKEVVKKLK